MAPRTTREEDYDPEQDEEDRSSDDEGDLDEEEEDEEDGEAPPHHRSGATFGKVKRSKHSQTPQGNIGRKRKRHDNVKGIETGKKSRKTMKPGKADLKYPVHANAFDGQNHDRVANHTSKLIKAVAATGHDGCSMMYPTNTPSWVILALPRCWLQAKEERHRSHNVEPVPDTPLSGPFWDIRESLRQCRTNALHTVKGVVHDYRLQHGEAGRDLRAWAKRQLINEFFELDDGDEASNERRYVSPLIIDCMIKTWYGPQGIGRQRDTAHLFASINAFMVISMCTMIHAVLLAFQEKPTGHGDRGEPRYERFEPLTIEALFHEKMAEWKLLDERIPYLLEEINELVEERKPSAMVDATVIKIQTTGRNFKNSMAGLRCKSARRRAAQLAADAGGDSHGHDCSPAPKPQADLLKVRATQYANDAGRGSSARTNPPASERPGRAHDDEAGAVGGSSPPSADKRGESNTSNTSGLSSPLSHLSGRGALGKTTSGVLDGIGSGLENSQTPADLTTVGCDEGPRDFSRKISTFLGVGKWPKMETLCTNNLGKLKEGNVWWIRAVDKEDRSVTGFGTTLLHEESFEKFKTKLRKEPTAHKIWLSVGPLGEEE